MDFSTERNRFYSMQCIFYGIQLLIPLVTGLIPLNQDDLREKYGQENTTFNVGHSCNRVCDGKPKTCYYEFKVRKYDTMCGYVFDNWMPFHLKAQLNQ